MDMFPDQQIQQQQQQHSNTAKMTFNSGIDQLIRLEKMIVTYMKSLREYRMKESQSGLYKSERNTLEGRLMRYFAKQLFIKIGSGISPYQKEVHFPNLNHFLDVVDVKEDRVKEINKRCSTVEEICLFSDEKIRGIFYSHSDDTQLAEMLNSQYLRLCMALNILCSYVGSLQKGVKTSDLHWHSWFETFPEGTPNDVRRPIENYLQEFITPTPITPAPGLRHQSTSSIPNILSDTVNMGPRRTTSLSSSKKPRPAPIIITSPSYADDTDSDHSKSRSSSVSQSPRTPNSVWNFQMAPNLQMGNTNKLHRFSKKSKLLISIACDHCHRLMFNGLKCKDCGFKCHKKCSPNVATTCSGSGLRKTYSEPDYIQYHIEKRPKHCSVNNLCERTPKDNTRNPDSASITSSASSMSSSSPFPSDSPRETSADVQRFSFPDVSDGILSPLVVTDASTTETIKSTDTVITNHDGSEMSKSSTEKSENSEMSEEFDTMDELNEQISGVPRHVKLRDRGSLMSEWVIPISDIKRDILIGQGRMGTVYKARWHGEVALKILNLENPTVAEKDDFKNKIKVLRSTRHDNLLLFMGACMEPPSLAIVCSLCKGNTLYKHIHLDGQTFYDSKLIDMVRQISHGMSYLHAKEIVHRDLKTKNIFLEGNRIVITDFGLVSSADVRALNSKRPNNLIIPRGWLCYQAPEVIRALDPLNPGAEVLVYTKKTDIYAFGSVWFELLAGHWPFYENNNNNNINNNNNNNESEVEQANFGHSTESIIWQIGKGYKQTLSNVEISREMKDIFNMIWNVNPEVRPSFHHIVKAIEQLPKRKLIRSPSQPTYLLTSRYVNALDIIN